METDSHFPKVQFKLNLELDKQMISAFLSHCSGGVDFGRGIRMEHDALRAISADDKALIGEYCEKFYERNDSKLRERLVEFQKSWAHVNLPFFEQTLRIFKGARFPDGEYQGYLSIIDCNPRFLHNCTFQIYWRKPAPVSTIAHELMHFMFFHYARSRHPRLFAALDPDADNVFWALSELFNNVVLDLPQFVSALGLAGEIPYPGHAELLQPMRKIWESCSDIDTYLPRALRFLKKTFEAAPSELI